MLDFDQTILRMIFLYEHTATSFFRKMVPSYTEKIILHVQRPGVYVLELTPRSASLHFLCLV